MVADNLDVGRAGHRRAKFACPPPLVLVFLWPAVLACGPATTISGTLPMGDDETRTLETQQKSRDPEDPLCAPPRLAELSAELFQPSCGSCHGGETPSAELDLTLEEVDLRMRLFQPARQSPSGMPLISPGSIGASYLYLKVAVETPLIGDRMPRRADPLSECLKASLRTWIEEGAN